MVSAIPTRRGQRRQRLPLPATLRQPLRQPAPAMLPPDDPADERPKATAMGVNVSATTKETNSEKVTVRA